MNPGPRCRTHGWFQAPRSDGRWYCKKCARLDAIARYAAKKGAVMPSGRPRTKPEPTPEIRMSRAEVNAKRQELDRDQREYREAQSIRAQESMAGRSAESEAECERHAAEHREMIARLRAVKRLHPETGGKLSPEELDQVLPKGR